MDFFSSLPNILLLTLVYISLGNAFTVIMSDSGAPSALVDGPQTAFIMNNNGARTDAREQEAVYDIMKATGNDWATDIPDVCRGRWHGIECMPDKDNVYHVVSLSFGALSDDTAFPTCDLAESFISPSIIKLPHLRNLFFYQCLTGNPQPIPKFLGRLGPTLQSLVLRDNGHIGPIPNELGNLTRLKVLDLHKNNLNGSIPVSFGRFTGLRSLDLSVNQLTGLIPNLSFPELSILDLNQNHLTGLIPATLMSCESLIKVDMSRNRLSGTIPESIGRLKNLILVDLSYNNLIGPLPESLKDLNVLQALILNGNPTMTTTIPNNAFDGLKDLMILILSEMNLQGIIPESLGRLRNLRVLHLDRNCLNGPIPASFGDLKNLSELRLDNNRLIGALPFKRDMVWRMRRKLRLHNNSGLCYDAKSGLGDDLDALFDSGIGRCEAEKSEKLKPVQHLSTEINDGFKLGSSKNSAGGVEKPYLLRRLLLLQSPIYLLFAVCCL